MFRSFVAKAPTRFSLAAFVLFLVATAAFAQEPPCSSCPTNRGPVPGIRRCPPFLKWYMEGPPRICFKCGCPKPICDPYEAPNWGYYQKCWSPWPFPPDWSHCPVPPPASQVFPGMIPAGQATSLPEIGPSPRNFDVRPPL